MADWGGGGNDPVCGTIARPDRRSHAVRKNIALVDDDRTIDSHIKRVRRKFREVDGEFEQIETLYGIGYRYRDA